MQHDGQGDARTAALVGAALVVAVLAVFGRSAGFELVNLDDFDYVAENPHVRGGLSWAGARWAFTAFHSANWHPLTWLSHMLDVELFGTWAGGHHLSSVVLHAATVVALFAALRRLTGRTVPSAVAAAAFGLHPLRVESVAWVAERKDVLSGLLFALTLLAYAGYARRPFAVRRYALVVLALALGLMAKPMLVTVPAVLLLLDVWPLCRIGWNGRRVRGGPVEAPGAAPGRPWLEKLPLAALAAASIALTVGAQEQALSTLERVPPGARVANAVVAAATYLRQLVLPVELAAFYPLRPVPAGAVAVAALVLVALTAAAVALRRRAPYALVGWLWYLGMLVPVAGIVQVGSQAHADRYTYLPQIGIVVALAFGVADVASSRTRRRIAIAACAGVLVAWSALAARQVGVWRNSVTLWTHAVACTPDSGLAWHLLAGAYVREGRDEDALAGYRRAAELWPHHVKIQSGLAATLRKLGRLDEALARP